MQINIYHIIYYLLMFIYWFLIVNVTLRVIIKRRAIQSIMAWLLVIYIVPIVGIIIYLLLGELNIGKRRIERHKVLLPSIIQWINNLKEYKHIFSTENSEVARSIFKLCERQQGISGLKGNRIQLITSTDDAMQSLIKDITGAKNNIEMVFYIWKVGGLVDQVTEALIAAANRGIRCRLMLDSAGSLKFFRSHYPNIMRNAGIDVVEALNINILRIFFRRMDLRQHRKMVLIDNHISYTGSMNMVDPRYFKQYSGVGQWIDIITRIEGPITTAMGIIYACDWEMETGQHILPDINLKQISFEKSSNNTMQIIASGPGLPKGVIHQALLTSIYAAREYLVMTTPYLIPSDDLLYAICTAAQRGVKVNIIIPYYNDSILVSWASRVFFTELLEAGVLIHQFEGGLLHTKSVLVDGQLSLVGTVNLDMRSMWLNFEITLVIDDSHFGSNLERIQQNYIASSKLINANLWSKRPYWQRIIERLFYFFSPLL